MDKKKILMIMFCICFGLLVINIIGELTGAFLFSNLIQPRIRLEPTIEPVILDPIVDPGLLETSPQIVDGLISSTPGICNMRPFLSTPKNGIEMCEPIGNESFLSYGVIETEYYSSNDRSCTGELIKMETSLDVKSKYTRLALTSECHNDPIRGDYKEIKPYRVICCSEQRTTQKTDSKSCRKVSFPIAEAMVSDKGIRSNGQGVCEDIGKECLFSYGIVEKRYYSSKDGSCKIPTTGTEYSLVDIYECGETLIQEWSSECFTDPKKGDYTENIIYSSVCCPKEKNIYAELFNELVPISLEPYLVPKGF